MNFDRNVSSKPSPVMKMATARKPSINVRGTPSRSRILIMRAPLPDVSLNYEKSYESIRIFEVDTTATLLRHLVLYKAMAAAGEVNMRRPRFSEQSQGRLRCHLPTLTTALETPVILPSRKSCTCSSSSSWLMRPPMFILPEETSEMASRKVSGLMKEPWMVSCFL